jgi:hypothetical protein
MPPLVSDSYVFIGGVMVSFCLYWALPLWLGPSFVDEHLLWSTNHQGDDSGCDPPFEVPIVSCFYRIHNELRSGFYLQKMFIDEDENHDLNGTFLILCLIIFLFPLAHRWLLRFPDLVGGYLLMKMRFPKQNSSTMYFFIKTN